MAISNALVIIGAGLAGAKAAEGARSAGFDGRVVLVGAEPHPPYERPSLSKAVLRGELAPATTQVHDEGFYETNEIDLLTGRTVEALDPRARQIRLDDGRALSYGSAVLATGAAPRRLTVPGRALDGVHYVRDVEDASGLSEAARGARRVAVVGAGWIGSEVAASIRQMGPEVVLIGSAPAPLHDALGADIGAEFARLHADHGVDLRMGTRVLALEGTSAVQWVVLADGTIEPADVVVAGIGVTPRVHLADAAGLAVDDGVVVDEHLESSVPGVYAAGDVASAFHPHYGRHLRVEHWANALNQGLTAGRNAVGGRQAYDRLPYFFSDQYDVGLEYVGRHRPDDQVVVRGSLGQRRFIAFWHRTGKVTAAMSVNVWDVVDDLKAIVAAGAPVPVDRLADSSVELSEVA